MYTDNRFNLLETIQLGTIYNVIQNNLTIDDYLTYLNINTTLPLYQGYYPNVKNNESTYDIGYEYAQGINSYFMLNQYTLFFKYYSEVQLNVGDTLELNNGSIELDIDKILSQIDNEYILFAYADSQLYKTKEYIKQSNSNIIEVGNIYNVTLDSYVDDIIEFNGEIVYQLDISGLELMFGSFNDMKFGTIDDDYFFVDISENLHDFTYNLKNSDREVLTLIGYDNYKWLDIYVPYISYVSWMESINQIENRISFLNGYYNGLLVKLEHTLYEFDLDYNEDYTSLVNLPKYNYDYVKNKIVNDNSKVWTNDLIMMYSKIYYYANYYKQYDILVKKSIYTAFNFNSKTKNNIEYLNKNKNMYSDKFDYNKYSTIKLLLNDELEYTIFISQMINSIDTINANNIDLNNTYNNTLAYIPNMLPIFEVYNMDDFNIPFYNNMISDVDFNSPTNIVSTMKQTMSDIINIDTTNFTNPEDFYDFIVDNFNTNSFIDNYIYKIDKYDILVTYNELDNVIFEGNIYSSVRGNNIGNALDNKKYWSFVELDANSIIAGVHKNNIGSYNQKSLICSYMNIFDDIKDVTKIEKQTIIDDYNGVDNEYIIEGYISTNYYVDSIIFNDNIFNIFDNDADINPIYNFSLFNLKMMNEILDGIFLDSEYTYNENINIVDNFIDSVDDEYDFQDTMLNDIKGDDNKEVKSIRVIKQENVNDFISKLNKLSK